MKNGLELHIKSMKNNTNNQEIYDTWSKSYDSYVLEQEYTGPKEIVSQLESMILNLNQKKIDILDFGCGTGLVGMEIKNKKLNVRLEGIDISPQMLEKARHKNCYDKLYEGDLLVENILKKKYQIIVSCGVFLEGHAPLEIINILIDNLHMEGFLLFTIRNSYLEKELDKFTKIVLENLRVKVLKSEDIKYLKDVQCIMFLLYRTS